MILLINRIFNCYNRDIILAVKVMHCYKKKFGVVRKGSKKETIFHYYNGNLVKDMHCYEEKLRTVDAFQGDRSVVIT